MSPKENAPPVGKPDRKPVASLLMDTENPRLASGEGIDAQGKPYEESWVGYRQ